jgi:hypothetical protein
MAASILSQDILAICLFLADGNIDLPVAEVIRRAEAYQDIQNRHFGISRSDFRNLFRKLLILEKGRLSTDDEILDIKLGNVINDILSFQYAHFNDEGEHWIMVDELQKEESNSPDIRYWYDYDDEEYQQKIIMKQKMIRFFKDLATGNLHPGSIKKFMEELNITDSVLYHNSRIGESS